MSHAQEIVHDLESLVPGREIDGSYIHYGLELTLGVVAKEGQERNDAGRCSVQGELVLEYAVLLDEFGEALNQVGAI